MARARGVGRVITGGGLAIPAPYTRVYAQIHPLVGDDQGIADGGLDAAGQSLHVKYEGNLNLGSRSGGNQIPGGIEPPDYVPNKIVVEFDAPSCFTLPFEGQISLVGGSGDWKFGLFVHTVFDANGLYYQPQLRTLRTFVQAGVPFTVPEFHTYIMGSNSTDTFVLPTGDILQPSVLLPGSPIVAGTVLIPQKDTTVITGWMG